MTDGAQSYFTLSDQDKIEALEVGASTLGRPADLLEKDIWVVWTLNALFDSPIGEHLVFKGGTSLSKVYGAIDRFSEDIDVTYDIRQILGDIIGAQADLDPQSPSQAKRWTKMARERLPQWVGETALPVIQARIDEHGMPVDIRREGDNLLLEYTALRNGTGYVRPTVLLEFGARSTGEPAAYQNVVCDLASAIDQVLFPQAKPRVMKAERTFWEKATAMHVYCLRGEFRGGDRYARHWYDLDCLDQTGVGQSALDDRDLALEVAGHKQMFFAERDVRSEIIDYAKAVRGALCLVPEGNALDALHKDYDAMIEAGLFHSETVPFEDLISRLKELEDRANSPISSFGAV